MGLLANKVIVIVGGTSGIGLSAALKFVHEGAKVVAVGRDERKCQATASRLGDEGMALAGDAQDEDTAPKAIKLAMQTYGGFDGLFHVAGGSGRRMGDGPLHEMTLEGWEKTFSLNLSSIMLSNRAAVQSFMDRKVSGSILNTGSVLGYSPSPQFFTTHAYAAAKSAIIGFTKSIAAYYASCNIRANVLAPALVETPMAQRAARDETIMQFIKTKQPLDGGRIGQPADTDGLACYFMSDQSLFTTGQIIAVDGGWSISEGQIP